MLLLLGAVVAGVLTTLAPCVLPLLPVIIGGSVASQDAARWRRPLIITASLGASVVVFTLLLKTSAGVLGLDAAAWRTVSGVLLIAIGLTQVFPQLWEAIAQVTRLSRGSTEALHGASARTGVLGAVLTGAALGPVFSSCSPLYAYVIVTVLPASWWWGVTVLLAYVVGLCAALLGIAVLGRALIDKLGWAADPHGWVRIGFGVVFIVIGAAILLGWDHAVQAWILEHSPVAPWLVEELFTPSLDG